MTTNLTVKEIDQLTDLLVGDRMPKSRDKEKAVSRFSMLARQNGIEADILSLNHTRAIDAVKAHVARLDAKDAEIAKDAKPQAKASRKGSTPADKGIAAAKADDETIAASNGLTITDVDLKACKTLGGGKWLITKGDIEIDVSWHKDVGMFKATLRKGEFSLTQEAKSFGGAARAAARNYNATAGA